MPNAEDFCVRPFVEGSDVAGFDCGNKDLNEFLTTDEVLQYQDEWYGYTYLVCRVSDWELVGYYTIAADSIEIPDDWVKKSMKKHLGVKKIPAVLLGRFATHNNFKKRGIGSLLLKHIITEELETPRPARIMRLTAYQETVQWYLDRGFDFISEKEHEKADKPGSKPRLYIDLKELPNPNVRIPKARG